MYHASQKGMLLSLKAIQSQSLSYSSPLFFVFFFTVEMFYLHENTHGKLTVCLFSKILKSLFNKSTTERKNNRTERRMG